MNTPTDKQVLNAVNGKDEAATREIAKELKVAQTYANLVRIGITLKKNGWTKHLRADEGFFWKAPELPR